MSSKSKVETPELSIIVTAHAEGIIAHKTMRCVFENQKLLETNKIKSEVIIHLDSANKETKEYFSRYKNSTSVTIYENSFHDSGKSRNFCTKKANGTYLAFIDADDLVSSNWLLEAYDLAKKQKSLVHPEAVLEFGIDVISPRLWLQKNSKPSKAENAKDLIVTNRWVSTIVGPRQIFLDFPYPSTEHGFGNEDYEFNLATISASIPHLVAPETILFYRQKLSGSLLSQAAARKYVQRLSPLFDIDFYKKNCQPAPNSTEPLVEEKTAKEKAIERYISLRNNHPLVNKVITPVATLAKKVTGRTIAAPTSSLLEEKKKQIPEFVLKEWREINKIDTSIYPNEVYISNLWFYRPEENDMFARAYYELTKNIKKLPEYVFIVPWLVSGGADRVLLNYLEAFSKNSPGARIAVIATTTEANTWADHLPSNADLVEFGSATDGMDEFNKEYLFSQFLIQLKCRKLHIINSDFGYRWAMSHRALVKDNFTLNVSIFTDDTLPGTEGKIRVGYANPHVVEIYPLINRILTDNVTAIKYLSNLNGFNEKKFTVHYQPNTTKPRAPEKKQAKRKMRILWASRVCTPKHPELLRRIAKLLPAEQYEIDVFGRFDNDYDESFFEGIKSINYCGAYDGIDNLDVSPYDTFLYTSLNDGIPNILLEIASAGLPIIASDAGGVNEVIKNHQTGILVKDETPEAFLEAIEYAEKNPDEMFTYAKNAQELVQTRHNWKKFSSTVKRDLPI